MLQPIVLPQIFISGMIYVKQIIEYNCKGGYFNYLLVKLVRNNLNSYLKTSC